METEIIKAAQSGLSTGEITGGGFFGVVTVAIGLWFKSKSDKKAETSTELELRLLKFLSVTVMEAMEKMSKDSNDSNEKTALLFVKYLEGSAESRAIITESFKSVYKKIEDESKQVNSRVDHVQNHWVHSDRLVAELKHKKDIGPQ